MPIGNRKKKLKLKPIYSDTPPPGWPTEEEWKKIEKELESKPVTRIWTPEDGPLAFAKSCICEQFVIYRRVQKISQRDLAKLLKVSESRVSEILHYNHETYTIDRLFELLLKIKPKAALDLKTA